MKLSEIAKEIREVISERQKQLGLVFEEERHIYTMNGKTDWPSVSKVLKKFYKPFPTEEAAYNKAGGDPEKQQQLIEEWAAAGQYSTNLGSRVHFILEEEAIKRNGSYKEVRKPIFECDLTQLMKSDKMIVAGKRYLDLLEQRQVELLDTEMVLGDPTLGYTGQPEPFQDLPNNALGHYYVQLPLYGKLILEMLKGSKFENIKIYGCIIAHLRDDTQFEEFRVPKKVVDTVMGMDMRKYLNKK